MLPAEGAIRELHVVGGFDMIIGESKRLVIPRVVGVFIARPQIAELGSLPWLFEHPADQLIEALALEDNRNWNWQIQLGLPTNNSIHAYPVSRSGRSE